MKTRFLYPVLFLPPCLMAAGIAAVIFGAGVGGVLWLLVYGDDTWPAWTNMFVMALAAIVAAATLGASLAACYRFGKRQESAGGLDPRHVAFAIVLTVLLPALVVLHQWQVGNLG